MIGGSLGGMRALALVLSGLPAAFPVPIAAVLHRSADSTAILRSILQRSTALRVREAQDKDELKPGHAYVAPADYHLLIDEGALALSTEGPVTYARPSLDVLFETAADWFGSGTIGVVLTGANHDGARGAARIRRRGGYVVVQDPTTAECAAMPRAAIAAASPDTILPPEEIAGLLLRLCPVRTLAV